MKHTLLSLKERFNPNLYQVFFAFVIVELHIYYTFIVQNPFLARINQ